MLDDTQLEIFLSAFGSRALPHIKILDDNQAFMSAVKTPAGKEILKDAVAGMQKSMEAAANWDGLDNIKRDRCLADMRAYKGICERWANIIEKFNSTIGFIKKTIE